MNSFVLSWPSAGFLIATRSPARIIRLHCRIIFFAQFPAVGVSWIFWSTRSTRLIPTHAVLGPFGRSTDLGIRIRLIVLLSMRIVPARQFGKAACNIYHLLLLRSVAGSVPLRSISSLCPCIHYHLSSSHSPIRRPTSNRPTSILFAFIVRSVQSFTELHWINALGSLGERVHTIKSSEPASRFPTRFVRN